MSRPRTRSELDLVVMGYSAPHASPASKLRMTEFSILLGQFAMIDVSITALGSYERVAQLIFKGEIDLAWLSPIPFISLARQESVVALASQYRKGSTTFQASIIVPAGSRVRSMAQLKGKRAAWVDRHSASGFVLPRIEFWEAGLDPRRAFASEKFYGSHEAVVRAVAEGHADFGATHRGSWLHTPHAARVREVAVFGEIPSDVIAARADLQPKAREIVSRAFLRLSSVPEGLALIRDVFGAEDFRKPNLASYERLREAAAGANEEGLLDIDAAAARPSGFEEAAADATIQIRGVRPRADSTNEVEAFEVVDAPPKPRARQPSRPAIQARPTAVPRAAVPPRPLNKVKPGSAPRPAGPGVGSRPLPPRKP